MTGEESRSTGFTGQFFSMLSDSRQSSHYLFGDTGCKNWIVRFHTQHQCFQRPQFHRRKLRLVLNQLFDVGYRCLAVLRVSLLQS